MLAKLFSNYSKLCVISFFANKVHYLPPKHASRRNFRKESFDGDSFVSQSRFDAYSYVLNYRLPANYCLKPPALISTPLISFCTTIFQTVFQIDVLSRSSFLLAMFLCCLRSYDHRCPIYEHRVLHSSTILEFKAIFLPSPLILTPHRSIISFNVSSPHAYSNPPAIRHLRVCWSRDFLSIDGILQACSISKHQVLYRKWLSILNKPS